MTQLDVVQRYVAQKPSARATCALQHQLARHVVHEVIKPSVLGSPCATDDAVVQHACKSKANHVVQLTVAVGKPVIQQECVQPLFLPMQEQPVLATPQVGLDTSQLYTLILMHAVSKYALC